MRKNRFVIGALLAMAILGCGDGGVDIYNDANCIDTDNMEVTCVSPDVDKAYVAWYSDLHSHSTWEAESRKLEVFLDVEENLYLSDISHPEIRWTYGTIPFLSSLKEGDRLDFNIPGTVVNGEEVTLRVYGVDDGELSNLYAETKFIFGGEIPSVIIKPLQDKPIGHAVVFLQFGTNVAGKYIFAGNKIYVKITRIIND